MTHTSVLEIVRNLHGWVVFDASARDRKLFATGILLFSRFLELTNVQALVKPL